MSDPFFMENLNRMVALVYSVPCLLLLLSLVCLAYAVPQFRSQKRFYPEWAHRELFLPWCKASNALCKHKIGGVV